MSERGAKFVRTGTVVARRVAGELVLIPRGARVTASGTRGAELFVLSGSGGDLWEWLESPQDIDGLARKLTSEFDVAEGVARDDISAFLKAMVAIGAVTTVESGG